MRVAFPFDLSAPEQAELDRLREAATTWWTAFAAREDDLVAALRGQGDWDLGGWVVEQLGLVWPGLCWEFGPGVDKDYRFAITVESVLELQPIVDVILEQQPKSERFSFHDGRLRVDPAEALTIAKHRGGVELQSGDLGFQLQRSERGNLIDLQVFHPKPDDQVEAAIYTLVESLLGEGAFHKWLGGLEICKRPGLVGRLVGRSKPLALEQFQDTFDSLRGAVVDQLPAESLLVEAQHGQLEEAEWSVVELKAPDGLFEAAARRDDLIVASTMMPDLAMAEHRSQVFASERFGRHGETFAYLKLRAEDPNEVPRLELEEALGARLVPAGLGCVVGGGIGARYTYVDLALYDVQGACGPIREVAASFDLPGWLLFFDDVYAEEWLAVGSSEPPPERPGD